MGRVLTNNVALSVGDEAALGVTGAQADWLALEPNSLGTFGASISTIVRSPISKSRQRKKGTVTDLDSSAEFEHDLIYDVVARMLRGFMFARGVNELEQAVPVSAVAIAGGMVTLTVPAVAAPRNDKYETTTLLWLHGFDDATNNGRAISDDLADGDAVIAIGVSLAGAQVVKPAVAGVVYGYSSVTGSRLPNANLTSWTYAAATKTAVLLGTAGGAVGTVLRATGLRPGQLVHIGSIPRAGADVDHGLPGDLHGYARVRSIAATSVTFDKMDPALQATVAAIGTDLDICFGDHIRPADAADAAYLEQSYSYELLHPGLGDGGANPNSDAYIYSRGNFCNTLGINLPLTEKATMSYNFIGTDTASPTIIREQIAGADIAPRDMVRTEAFNTTADIARLRITEVDEEGLTTDFKSLTFTINNNVSPEKVLRTLGARFMNIGEFAISIETQVLFTSPLVLAAIRNNETVSMDFILKNNDGVLGFDVPAMTLGGGGRDYPENESVLVNLTCETFEDPLFGSSLGFSLIPMPLP